MVRANLSLPDDSSPDETRHRIRVDDGHELYVERHGTRGAIPTVVLHGGPGGGLSHAALDGFDLARHDIVLFDQRGAGRSTPLAEVAGNTTPDLIRDLEAIRALFGFDGWMVAGGSWGSCLGLAYAQAHPDRVTALRLHGIFLARPSEISWWFHGVANVFPDHWAEFAAHVPEDERDDLLRAYYTRLMSPDPDIAQSAAWHLRNFSARTQTFGPDAAHVARLLESPNKYLPVARLFTHYCMNRAFMPEGALLEGIDRIRHIPAEILQGRYDMVTPMASAWALHQAWPEAGFQIVTVANHTASPDMLVALRAASARLAQRITDNAQH
ncbi:MAG: prolyl aminopeptidase [Paracoccus sp. (in: a-proteobacteria)]